MKVLEEAQALGEYPFLGSNELTYSAGGRFNPHLDEFDLIELIQDEHGWRPWKATKDSVCPVGSDVCVHVQLAYGGWFTSVAKNTRWHAARDIGESSSRDVVAYKIIEEAQQ